MIVVVSLTMLCKQRSVARIVHHQAKLLGIDAIQAEVAILLTLILVVVSLEIVITPPPRLLLMTTKLQVVLVVVFIVFSFVVHLMTLM